MKTLIRLTLFSIFALYGLFNTAIAQTVTDSSNTITQNIPVDSVMVLIDSTSSKVATRHHSHFEAGMSYQSNDVYLGRKDSTVLPYYIPAFSYYHVSGLFATVSFNYLNNSTASRIDLVTLDAGYMFSKGGYDGQFTASKYFYNAQSTSVTSALTASLAYESSFDFGFIKPSFTGTLNIATHVDLEALFSIEHSFYLAGDKMDITPTFAVAGSTQNYYNDYYKSRRFHLKKAQKLQTGLTSISGTVLDASTFKILDYEPTIPINYRIGKCTINFSPTYSIPVHPATIALQTDYANGSELNRIKTEKIENSFYWTAGISFLF